MSTNVCRTEQLNRKSHLSDSPIRTGVPAQPLLELSFALTCAIRAETVQDTDL